MTATGERTFPTISDEGLAGLRARRGIPAVRGDRQKYTQITADAARGFSLGAGDTNPLYTDEDYARATRWGTVVAPPCILLGAGIPEGRDLTPAEREAGRGGGLPGVHGMYAGHDWEWYQPMVEGDRIHRVQYEAGFSVKQGNFAGRQILQHMESLYRNQRREVVCKAVHWRMRTERNTAARRKNVFRSPTVWSGEELARIDAAYAAETPRGAEPRWWEDVRVGDELGEMVRGPFRVTDAVSWETGAGGPYARTGRSDHEFRRRHPGAYARDPQGVWDIVERVHWDDGFAREVGVPAAYDYGAQRIAWSGNFLTNWMGDDAWLKRMWVQIRRFGIIGDLQTYRGRVIDKRVEDGEHQVVCDFQATNQLGEITAPGQAIVLLPSRAAGMPALPAAGQPPYPEWGPETVLEPLGLAPVEPGPQTHGFAHVGVPDS